MKIENHLASIREGCRRFDVKRLHLVGSAARGEATPESDVDLLVSFNNLDQPGIADRYFGFLAYLEKELHAPVDLIEESAVRNPFFKESINRRKKLIYE